MGLINLIKKLNPSLIGIGFSGDGTNLIWTEDSWDLLSDPDGNSQLINTPCVALLLGPPVVLELVPISNSRSGLKKRSQTQELRVVISVVCSIIVLPGDTQGRPAEQ